MTFDSPKTDCNQTEKQNLTQSRRINNNQMMLDLRQQIQLQEQIIRSLLSEKNSLTKELDSRLFLVEAQLRREQKQIEEVLNEKEQLIHFQAMQIQSLKKLLDQNPNYRRSSKRMLSKRYSVALDEYMKDHCIVSRALPVVIQPEAKVNTTAHIQCSRTRSLPELRFREQAENQSCCQYRMYQQQIGDGFVPNQSSSVMFDKDDLDATCEECCRILSQEVLDEITSRRWTSDCDSENSDSLDSGISSPSIPARIVHEFCDLSTQGLYIETEKGEHPSRRNSCLGNIASGRDNHGAAFETEQLPIETVGHKPRRSSSIGSFIHRTFSSSEKTKDNHETRRHSSFSGAEAKVLEGNPPRKDRFISSANRTFGTNHRSVTKPRDVKFRKLFKFKRRTEPDITVDDYMTV